MASGISNTFRLSGVAAGIAALGAVFQHAVAVRLHELVPQAGARAADALAAGGVPAAVRTVAEPLRHTVAIAAPSAFVSGFDEVLLIGALTSLAGGLCALALIRARDFQPPPHAQPATVTASAPAAASG